MEHGRSNMVMLISFLLILTLTASTFIYVLLPAETVFNSKECSIGKVVDKGSGYFYLDRYQVVYIWEFETGEVRNYFAASPGYDWVKKGDIVRFCNRGYFITTLVGIKG